MSKKWYFYLRSNSVYQNGNQQLTTFPGLHETQNSIALVTRVRVFWSISDKYRYLFVIRSVDA
jgi:hypothetical protein